LPTARRQQAVIPWSDLRAAGVPAPLRCVGVRWPIDRPSMGLLRRPAPGEIVEGGRSAGPVGRARIRAHLRKPTYGDATNTRIHVGRFMQRPMFAKRYGCRVKLSLADQDGPGRYQAAVVQQ